MNKIKRVAASALLIIFCFLFSGCDIISSGQDLLTAPLPGGELSEIKAALDSLMTEKYTLKYPTEGEFRSAIVRYDLTGNGNEDAIAFYSTQKENISSMHIAVLTKKEEEWIAVKDVAVLASGVEKVEFNDLNGDGTSEIIVGWSIFGSVDKQVSVYSFDSSMLTLTPRLNENYTEFLCCNLDTDGQKELMVIKLNTADKKASARLYELKADGINEISSCETDGNVTTYQTVTEAKLLDGKTAIFLDGQKGLGACTEIIFLSGGKLVNPLFDKESGKVGTERPSSVSIMDINGDGSPDIPMLEVLPDYEGASESEKIYVTKWCSFDGKNLAVVLTAVMNYTDGYYVEIPKALQGKITVTRNVESRVRTFYLYDTKEQKRGVALFKVMAVSENNWISDVKDSGEWKEALTGNAVVYAVQKSKYEGTEALSDEQIIKLIKKIG